MLTSFGDLMKVTTLVLIMTSFTVCAASELLEFGAKDFRSQKLKKSKWQVDVAYNYLPWKVVLPEYEGTFDRVKDEDNIALSGMSLGFGRQFYLGSGISSTFKLTATGYGSFEEVEGKAGDGLDLTLTDFDLKQTVGTGEVSGSLDYIIDSKLITFQPFIEFAAGKGVSTINRSYKYEGGAALPAPNEERYDVKSSEEFDYSRIGIGVNFISAKGLISYFKVSQTSLAVVKREFKGKSRTQSNTGAVESEDEEFEDLNEKSSVTMASIGIGYLF